MCTTHTPEFHGSNLNVLLGGKGDDFDVETLTRESSDESAEIADQP